MPLGIVCGELPPDEPGPAEEPPPGEDPVPEIPPIRVSDVASFAPQPVGPVIEPHGIGVRGAPMNVAISAPVHTVGGTLFDLPVSVTFTPASYAIDYGDGSAQTVSGGVGTWEELGQEQLTATPTSHAYAERGAYVVTVSVSYSAVVDFGRWGAHPVQGLVTPAAHTTEVEVYEIRTGLVDSTCLEDPTGPGCAAVG
ncbi:hypothetical protein [Microbacterium sp. gxy059]|uniref:hypothetical protein n=1 Tax=Microbacterium sp. gxy059 TaxID=2957199 RepID=UPI003D988639